jgi:hypothetical protein
MSIEQPNVLSHSEAWIFQVKAAFAVSVVSMGVAIAYLPVDPWIRAFFALGTLFTITSSISLSKTLRDVHESNRIVNKVGEAKLERLLVDHDPYKLAG